MKFFIKTLTKLQQVSKNIKFKVFTKTQHQKHRLSTQQFSIWTSLAELPAALSSFTNNQRTTSLCWRISKEGNLSTSLLPCIRNTEDWWALSVSSKSFIFYSLLNKIIQGFSSYLSIVMLMLYFKHWPNKIALCYVIPNLCVVYLF